MKNKTINEPTIEYCYSLDFQEEMKENKRKEKISVIQSLILLTYYKMAPLWIEKCSLEELDILFQGISEKHWSFHELKKHFQKE